MLRYGSNVTSGTEGGRNDSAETFIKPKKTTVNTMKNRVIISQRVTDASLRVIWHDMAVLSNL
jgi:hypothetical protein